MKEAFNTRTAGELYRAAVTGLSKKQLAWIFQEGIRLYAGFDSLTGETHVELSPGNDERGAYSDFHVQQFDRERAVDFYYFDPESLYYGSDAEDRESEPNAGQLEELREYLDDACSNAAETFFDSYLEEVESYDKDQKESDGAR